MTDGSVSGRFELNVTQAKSALRGLRTDTGSADDALKRLGNRFDAMPKQAGKVKLLRKEIKGLGDDMVSAERKIKTAMNEKTRAVEKQTLAVKGLRTEIRTLGRQRATAEVNVKGLDSALAKIALVKRELRSLNRQKARVTVGGTSFSGDSEQAVQGTDRATKSLDRSLQSASGSAGHLATKLGLLTAALPIIQALGGAVTALGGSLAEAAAGAGATGAAGLGGLLVGGGGLASIGIPTIKSIKDAFTANSALKQAQRQADYQNKSATGNLYAVRNAQEALTASQEQATDAQQNLTLARRDALRALQDLDLQTKRSRLGERSSALALKQARADLARVLSDPTASANTIEQARIGLSSAKLDVTESKREYQRNRKDLRVSKRQGVNRAPTVVQANRQIRDTGYAVRDASEALTAAGNQQTGGSGSDVAQAKAERDRLVKRIGPGGGDLLSAAHNFAVQWRVATRSGRADIVSFATSGIGALNKLRPALAKSANSTVAAFTKQGDLFFKFLDGSVTKRFIRTGTAIFDENIGNVRRSLQNILTWFGHLVEAARPFFKEFTDWTSRATKGWADQTRNTDAFRERLRPLVQQTKDWGKLIGSVYHLFKDLFTASAPAGGGLVLSLSAQLDRWDRWVQKNPAKVQAFFKRTADETRGLARGLVGVFKILNSIATTLQPILSIVSALVPLLAKLPVGGLGALLAGGAFLGTKGRASGVTGVALRRGGGGVSAGEAVGGTALLGGAARVIAKRFAVISALFAASAAISTKGNLGQRAQAAGHAIIPFIPAPELGTQSRSLGQAAAAAVLNRGSLAGTDRRISTLRSHLAAQGLYGPGHTLIDPQDSLRGPARKRAEAQLDALLKGRKEEIKLIRESNAARDKARGGAHEANLQVGFGRNVKRSGLVAGTSKTVQQAILDMTAPGVTSTQAAAIGVPLAKFIRDHAKGNKQVVALADQLDHEVNRKYKKLSSNTTVVFDRLITGTQSQWKTIATQIGTQADAGVTAGTLAFQKLDAQAIAGLVKMGYTTAQAQKILTSQRAGSSPTVQTQLSAGTNLPVSLTKKRARGGRMSGIGLHDTVPMADGGWGAPGELVVNRHQERMQNAINRMIGAPSLGQIVGAINTPHSAPMRASGGRVGGFSAAPGTNFSVGSEPTIARDLARLGRYLHTTVTGISGYRTPAHSVAVGGFADDPHTRGAAADIGVPGGFLYSGRANSALARFGLYRPFYPAQAKEYNHVQLLNGSLGAIIGGLSAAASGKKAGKGSRGFTPIHLAGVTSGLSGYPGAMADAASALYGGALQHKVNHHLASKSRSGGGGTSLGSYLGGPSGGSAGSNQRLGQKMMLAAGFSADQWPSLRALWTQESGWNANAVNPHGGAYGIPQSLGHGHPFNLGDARGQIAWGLNYIKGRYGTPSAAEAHERAFNWYSGGGRMPWFGKGGSATFHRPTMIGVGDGQATGGSETVSVTRNPPGGGRGPGGRSVSVTMKFGDVTVSNLGDFKKVVEAAAEVVAEKLTAAITKAEAHA